MSVSLSEHLPLLATAPAGIKKLRGLILELAVRGKLVPQDHMDEPASDLLKRIAAEKTRLVAEGKIRKGKPLAAVGEDKKPFDIPAGWEWARLNDFVKTIVSGGTPSKNNAEYWDGEICWASVKDLGKSKYLTDTQDRITAKGLENGSRLAQKGALIICTRMGLGKIAVASIDVAINQDLKAIDLTEHLSVDYFINFYRTLNIVGSGMTVAGIKQDELLAFLVPTPPLAEQHRIVAKIDELMALCDRMEAEQADAETAHATLVQTLLGTLTQSCDAAELAANWQRLSQHFDTLFTTEASLDALKQTILQLAVMGKLVPQDPTDEPASELLNRIAAKKARLVAEGTFKKSKPMPPVGEDEQPFEVPGGWEWVRWNDVAQKIGDIDHKMPDTVKDGVPYVSPRDFYPDNRIDFEGAKRVSRDDFLRLSAKIRPEVDDIIYPRYGTIGENRLVVDDLEFLASYSCCVIKTLYGFVAPKFQFYFSISQCCRDQAKAAENKTTQANVGIKSIQEFALPLPPIAEQHRIVAKVDELMALCDSLKADLAESRARQARLATTLIESALQAA